jgi:HPt (histidine-containing phosphotransfer) domain-containing protein
MYNQPDNTNVLFEQNLMSLQPTTADSHSEVSPVNRNVLDELTLGDADLLDELIKIYLEQFEQQLQEIKTAIESKNADQLFKTAHKAVGGNATFGMTTVVPALRELEKMGKENQFEEAEKLFVLVHSEFQIISRDCQSILDEPRS